MSRETPASRRRPHSRATLDTRDSGGGSDADLYSSTIFVLRAMRDVLRAGTIVIFDEYWDIRGEFRALEEFSRESGKAFEYLVISDTRAVVRFTA